MLKLFLQLGIVLLLLSGLGCHKSEVPVVCPLTSYDYYDGIADVHVLERMTHKDGLLYEVFTGNDLSFVMEYDAQRRLTGSRMYDNSRALIYQISFVYSNNRITEEIWRDASTQEVYDHVFLTYNQQGELVRNESFILDYHTDFTYYASGSLKSWHVVDHGINFAKAEYTYGDNYKNPYNTVKGIPHAFYYTNSAFTIRTGPRWYTSEKVTLWDENNEPFTLYEQDPTKTVWHPGQHNYPLQSDYVDRQTAASIVNTFTYECNAAAVAPNTRRIAPAKFEKSGIRLPMGQLRASKLR